MQSQDIETLQHVVENVRFTDIWQLLQQLVEILQRLWQCVQRELEFPDRSRPEVFIVIQVVAHWHSGFR